MARILVVGVPRSGSTWVARVLARSRDACLLHEPDNHFERPFAMRAKRALPGGGYPVLRPEDEAPAYETLWRQAFGSRGSGFTSTERLRRGAARRLLARAGRDHVARAWSGGPLGALLRAMQLLAVPERPPRHAANLVVKSVHAATAVEWIAERMPAGVVVVTRDVRNVVSSWLEIGWLDDTVAASPLSARKTPEYRLADLLVAEVGAHPPVGHARLERVTWFLAVLTRELERVAAKHPEWSLVSHEELCRDPARGLRELAESAGLVWTEQAEKTIEASSRPGRGYETKRVASELPEIWRSRLTKEQAARVEAELVHFERNGATLLS